MSAARSCEERKILRFLISLFGVIALSAVVMIVRDRRDRWLRKLAAADPDAERNRSRRIAKRIGAALVEVIRFASGFIAIAAFTGIWIGALTGIARLADLATWIACLAGGGMIYLWADRIAESLG
jgi:predicted PurR-regulated permease PerM